MPTWLLNSKKCSIRDAVLAGALALAFSSSAFAAIPKLESTLLEDIRARKDSSFAKVLKTWELRYSADAVEPLLKIANEKAHSDQDRYVAMMGAAKIGGKATAPAVAALLKDSSWMIRSGAIRALTALKDPVASASVLPLLNDPALVVRVEAVSAVEKLRPNGAVDALVKTLQDKDNYHQGKAQWMPHRVLAALVSLEAKEAAPHLKPLLDHSKDPELQLKTVATLEALTGRKLKAGSNLDEQVQAWKKTL